jgi:hypothetical protein
VSEGALERASGRERVDRGGGRVGAGRGLDSSPTSWAQPIVSPFGYISLENKII